ncbi:MAG: hypothetical protein WD068_01255 [Candidatus Babeliales bacterium]
MALKLQNTKDVIAMIALALLVPSSIIGVTIHVLSHLNSLVTFEIAAYIALLLQVASVYFGLILPTSFFSVGLLLGGLSALTGLASGLYFPFSTLISLLISLALLAIVGFYLIDRK